MALTHNYSDPLGELGITSNTLVIPVCPFKPYRSSIELKTITRDSTWVKIAPKSSLSAKLTNSVFSLEDYEASVVYTEPLIKLSSLFASYEILTSYTESVVFSKTHLDTKTALVLFTPSFGKIKHEFTSYSALSGIPKLLVGSGNIKSGILTATISMAPFTGKPYKFTPYKEVEVVSNGLVNPTNEPNSHGFISVNVLSVPTKQLSIITSYTPINGQNRQIIHPNALSPISSNTGDIVLRPFTPSSKHFNIYFKTLETKTVISGYLDPINIGIFSSINAAVLTKGFKLSAAKKVSLNTTKILSASALKFSQQTTGQVAIRLFPAIKQFTRFAQLSSNSGLLHSSTLPPIKNPGCASKILTTLTLRKSIQKYNHISIKTAPLTDNKASVLKDTYFGHILLRPLVKPYKFNNTPDEISVRPQHLVSNSKRKPVLTYSRHQKLLTTFPLVYFGSTGTGSIATPRIFPPIFRKFT